MPRSMCSRLAQGPAPCAAQQGVCAPRGRLCCRQPATVDHQAAPHHPPASPHLLPAPHLTNSAPPHLLPAPHLNPHPAPRLMPHASASPSPDPSPSPTCPNGVCTVPDPPSPPPPSPSPSPEASPSTSPFPSPASPSPVQLGAPEVTPSAANLTVVSGYMMVVTRAGGSSTESPAASAAPASMPPRAANLTGALQLQQQQEPGGPVPALPLVLGLEAVVDTERLVQWRYSSSNAQFYTETQINGTWQVAAAGPTTTPVAVVGTLRLVSPGWPGPGFTGSYQWSGNLTVSPDPWSLVTSAPAPNRRRQMLSAGVSVSVSGEVVVTEVTPVAVPNLLQDTLRGDNLHLLDADGSVVVVGAASLSAAALVAAPSWKQAGVQLTAPAPTPLSGYTGPAVAGIVVGSVAAGVVITLLAVFGFRRLRRDGKKQGLQEP